MSAFTDFMLWFSGAKEQFFTIISEKDAETVELALQSNPALAHVRNDEGFHETPLHLAARKSTPKIVKLLLSAGAEIDAKTDDGWTPLHKAAFWGNLKTVQLLVRHGASLDAVDEQGETPYDKASNRGNTEISTFLAGEMK